MEAYGFVIPSTARTPEEEAKKNEVYEKAGRGRSYNLRMCMLTLEDCFNMLRTMPQHRLSEMALDLMVFQILTEINEFTFNQFDVIQKHHPDFKEQEYLELAEECKINHEENDGSVVMFLAMISAVKMGITDPVVAINLPDELLRSYFDIYNNLAIQLMTEARILGDGDRVDETILPVNQ
jgi:hypothetical protein